MKHVNLSNEEKQLARDLVGFLDDGKLPKEFEMMPTGDIINYDLPQLKSKISKGKLLALKNAGLLDFVDLGNYLEVYIQEPLFEAVSNNFSFSSHQGWLVAEINLPWLIGQLSDIYQTEINSWCLDLGLDYEELGDTSAPKTKRLERLFLIAIKRKKLGKLFRLIEEHLPNEDWLKLFEE